MYTRFESRRAASRPIEVISSHWDTPLDFASRDLSPRGAYVLTELMPERGEHLVCSFDFGDDREFELFAEVVRVNLMRRRTDDADPGFGVRFLDASALDRMRIRAALSKTPPPLPKPRRVTGPPRAGGVLWGTIL